MGDCDRTRAKANCHNTSTSDLLGVEGREAVNACVKVMIYGKPETRKYDHNTAMYRLRRCNMGRYPRGMLGRINYYDLTLPAEFDKTGGYRTDRVKTYSIIDIRNALVKLDNTPFVEKYPKDGPSSERKRELIDKRRADVEREWNEAIANPDGQQIYSWSVAQRRVRDCFAGNFAGDGLIRIRIDGDQHSSFSIESIHDAVIKRDEGCLEKFSYQNKSAYEEIYTRRENIEKEYQEAIASNSVPPKYTQEEAEQRLRDCYCGTDGPLAGLTGWISSSYSSEDISIFDVHECLCSYDNRMPQCHKYPPDGPGSEELKQSIDEHRAKLKEEYEKFLATSDNAKKPQMLKYSQDEAELRVRDCFAFAGSDDGDTDMFPRKRDQIGMPRIYQTFTILDIKDSLDYFDTKKVLDKYPKQGKDYDKMKEVVDEERKSIKEEYEEAIAHVEIEHGSGFIISDLFILTNKHVIQTHLDNKDSSAICFSNSAIGELHCEVAHSDPSKDLALLYCPDLNLQESGICALQLSTQPLLPGMQIFSFGYPMSHTEKTALFVTGNVSGSKRTLSGHSMAVLNCSLNSGNSGGPVLTWVGGKVRVVGIATQKHIKRILTPDERKAILEIRKSMQVHAINDVLDYDVVFLSESGKNLR
ncbi:uncharacterized protein LOC111323487 [Stylophora pistillata]|uniref:Serine protease n=1 Tax=Stylophora pistillata TaxID=50429 RepID=A0A2B4SIQ3_STYPI|nr:uncharacterized protein LOC111323487 [Stylophora pistillata]PFX30544.1 putative periplasmic serine endoprotease DegP-like [Stylophora pistillata]